MWKMNNKKETTLVNLWPFYFAFMLSFAAVLIMWINHHDFFKNLKAINSKFLFANGFLLLMVTFIPFPTAVLAGHINSPVANVSSGLFSIIIKQVEKPCNQWPIQKGKRKPRKNSRVFLFPHFNILALRLQLSKINPITFWPFQVSFESF
jgi:uncharacterized membrane protein